MGRLPSCNLEPWCKPDKIFGVVLHKTVSWSEVNTEISTMDLEIIHLVRMQRFPKN